MNRRPSPLELESYVSGAADSALTDRVRAAAHADPSLDRWLRQRDQELEVFRLDRRRRSFAELAERAGSAPARARWARWCLAAAGVAAVAIGGGLLTTQSPRNGVSVRGGVSVKLARLHQQRAEVLRHGVAVHPGDRLRISVDDAHGGFITVILQDSSGAASLMYGAEELGRLSAGRHVLPDSLELDESLGPERLYVLLTDEPPPVRRWLAQLERAFREHGFDHGLRPAGARLSVITYEKVPAP